MGYLIENVIPFYSNYLYEKTLLFLTCLSSLNLFAGDDTKNILDYVDPFVGTGFHGHTYPGATVPFGAVQLSPDTRRGDWDACSGYHYSDSTLLGFSHTHLTGTGCIDLGDLLLRPTLSPAKEGNNCISLRASCILLKRLLLDITQ